ncbi:MAG: DUF3604 domain-containing protein [Candidatus Uhrbacteria bacterium]
MDNYQKKYQKNVGIAKLNIKKTVVGQKINCRLSYTAGFYGIDDSGSIKILFRIVSDFEEFQFIDPAKDNFVKISSSNENLKIKVGSKSGGALGKIYIRPWSRGFTLHFSGAFFKEGDQIFVDFKNWKMQTFCEKKFTFKIFVDPFATGRYLEIEKSPEIEVLPGQASQLKIVAPTKVEKNSFFKALIKIEDRFGNPCRQLDGIFRLEKNPQIQGSLKKINFKKGRAIIKLKIINDGSHFIKAKFDGIEGISNPVIVSQKVKLNYYWADFHAQSGETVGTNSVDDYFSFAKDYGFVDIASHQANDFQVTREFWYKINKVTKTINKEGEFIAFPGYEWSGNTPLGGDRNVIYKEENNPIFRSSHALLEDFKDLATDAPTAKELFKKLRSKKVIVFAHVGGRYADLRIHDEKIEKAVEIHSGWGTFEWFFHDALKRGYKIGVVANSDGHKGRPGASYPGVSHFGSFGGLTCVMSPRLTRKNVFESLYNRRCYATTGARIYLDVSYSIFGEIGSIGEIVTIKNNPVLKVDCFGTSAIDRIEIWNKDKKIYAYLPVLEDSKIKIVYSGSKVRGRDRGITWEGEVSLENNFFQGEIEKINFFNLNNYATIDSNILKWKGETTGGVQALMFDLKNDQGELIIKINNKNFKFSIKDIGQNPMVFNMGGLDAKVEVYRVSKDKNPKPISFEYKLSKLISGSNPVFVKVIQQDGHMAWSSPIYFEKK